MALLAAAAGFLALAAPAPGEEQAEAPRFAAVGPPLTALGTKIADPDWLVAWLIEPSRLRPGTVMPDPGMTPAEAQAVARYLLASPGAAAAAGKGGQGDPKVGEKLFVERGCRGCHAIRPGEKSLSERVPNLSDIGRKARGDWLAAWLRSPRAYNPHTAMPKLTLSEDDVRHLVAFLAARRDSPALPAGVPRFKAEGDAKAGRAAIERYDCAKCHVIEGFPAPAAPYQLSAAKEPSPDEVKRDGRLLIAYYNCRGCHRIEGEGGAIAQQLDRKGFAPPRLDGVGARLQASWLVDFLEHPKPLRPWLTMRMPDFGLPPAEAQALGRYFAQVANVPAKDEPLPAAQPELANKGLRRLGHYKCTQCHLAGAAPPAGADPEDLSIDLMNVRTRLRPSWIREFLARPKQIVGPQTRMPGVFYSVDGRPRMEGADEEIAAITEYLLEMKEPPAVSLARLEDEKKKAAAPVTDWTKAQY